MPIGVSLDVILIRKKLNLSNNFPTVMTLDKNVLDFTPKLITTTAYDILKCITTYVQNNIPNNYIKSGLKIIINNKLISEGIHHHRTKISK